MAIPVYLWLYSDEGKQLKGSVDVDRREGSIEITGLSHGVEIPTDNYSGKITATRQHSPLCFHKSARCFKSLLLSDRTLEVVR